MTTIGGYLLRRCLAACLLVFLIASVAFLLALIVPGDATNSDLTISVKERQEVRERLGLNRPVTVLYLEWVGRAVRGDLGESLRYGRPVTTLVAERARNTALLAAAALVLATAIGIPAGVLSGSRSGQASARAVAGLSLLCLSIPPLVASLVLGLLAARSGWLPTGGMRSIAADGIGWWAALPDLVRHLALPATALALPFAATLERLQSHSVIDTLSAPFVRASLARGVSRAEAIWRHAWPASLRPVLGIYGLVIGALFSGSFIVEVLASWPGLGQLTFAALEARDTYLAAGSAAAGAAALAAGTLIADVLLVIVDPRAAVDD